MRQGLMARLKMAEIPRNGNPTRVRSCETTGRPSVVITVPSLPHRAA
jgi:ribosomal protein S14